MRACKPATPGFLTTLAATVLLAIVSFSVPYFKSIYFLRAAITQSGVAGSVTFGVLGYCLDFNNQVTCSKPSVGWEFDPNQLLGNDLPVQIPNVVVKWLTYALVLHIVALGLAGVSAVFGLLAHVREMTMTCFSSCISGMAAAVALIAFIFDLVLFFAVRARINNVQGGSASIGNGLWMTLAAWALLFFSGCVFAFGRCCVSKRPSGRRSKDRDTEDSGSTKFDRESEHMRLDAVKAEADRKRQQAEQREVGLPAFHEYERTPLRRDEPAQYYEEEVEVVAPYSDRPRRDGSTRTVGGASGARAYEPGAPGTRTVDDYYNNTAPAAAAAANTYPPQPQRQASHSSQRTYHTQSSSQRFQSPPVPPMPANFADPYGARAVDPYLAVATAGAGAGAAYGHQGESSYSNVSSHQQYPSGQPYSSPGRQQYPLAGHQQYPSSGHQYSSPPPQDPYATSSYNPNVATMSPPQPTHYQDQSQGQAYLQQGYGQQQGYDAQQEYNNAAQQMYAQPEPQRANTLGGAYDPYPQTQQEPAYDQYNNQGYDSHGQQPYPQDPYAQQTQTYEQPRALVASPSPMTSPPEVNAAVPAAVGPSSHAWSEEGPSDAPPPQYEPMAGAAATSTRYPVEKR